MMKLTETMNNTSTGFQQELQSELLELHPRRLEFGKNKIKLKQCVHQETIDSMMSQNGLKRPREEEPEQERLFTPEFLQQNKKKIWDVKSFLCKKNTQDLTSYKTSAQELIGTDGDLETFYDAVCEERSTLLPWQVETDSQEWDLSSSNLLLKKQEQSSWFTTVTQKLQKKNSLKISCQSFTSSHVDIMEKESITPPPKKKIKKAKDRLKESNSTMRSRLVRLKPICDKDKLKKMFGVYRYIYNKCVDEKEIEGASLKEMSKWRTKLTKKENWEVPWLADLPSHGRQQAVMEFFKNKKENLKRTKFTKIKKFKMHKKSKYRSRQETIPLERHRIRKNGKLLEIMHNRKPLGFKIMDKCFIGREDENFLRKEIKLVRTRLGAYYAVVPFETKIMNPPNNTNICALDPGVRTFQTIYGTDGEVHHVGTSFEKCMKDLKKADYLTNLSTRLKSRKRRNCIYRKRRCFERVRNRIRDLHHKVSKWLTDHYRIIILPEFKSSNMYKNLCSKVCRSMATWSHYKFQQKLLEQAHRKGVKVLIANESYTSKTCGVCGELNNIGSSKTFNCKSCGIMMDRDVNGARNILLRALKYIL